MTLQEFYIWLLVCLLCTLAAVSIWPVTKFFYLSFEVFQISPEEHQTCFLLYIDSIYHYWQVQTSHIQLKFTVWPELWNAFVFPFLSFQPHQQIEVRMMGFHTFSIMMKHISDKKNLSKYFDTPFLNSFIHLCLSNITCVSLFFDIILLLFLTKISLCKFCLLVLFWTINLTSALVMSHTYI